jgi:hypothetical protein
MAAMGYVGIHVLDGADVVDCVHQPDTRFAGPVDGYIAAAKARSIGIPPILKTLDPTVLWPPSVVRGPAGDKRDATNPIAVSTKTSVRAADWRRIALRRYQAPRRIAMPCAP